MAVFKIFEGAKPEPEPIFLKLKSTLSGTIEVRIVHADGHDVSDGPALVTFHARDGKLTMHRNRYVSPTYVKQDMELKIQDEQ